jgi:YidC/Oxa1 family membrane protein insertase
MDRSSVLRWLVIAAAIFLFWKFGMPLIGGNTDKVQKLPDETYTNAPGFVPDVFDPPVTPNEPNAPPEGEVCKIQGNRFDALLSSRGAGVTHLYLREAQYAGPEGFDLSTTPDYERWRSLRTLFRGPDAGSQV